MEHGSRETNPETVFAAVSVILVAVPGPSVLFTISRALSAGRRTA